MFDAIGRMVVYGLVGIVVLVLFLLAEHSAGRDQAFEAYQFVARMIALVALAYFIFSF